MKLSFVLIDEDGAFYLALGEFIAYAGHDFYELLENTLNNTLGGDLDWQEIEDF